MVIEVVSIYPTMTLVIPKSCICEIQKIQKSFICGDDLMSIVESFVL
jgi:hypothetical protein